MSRSAYTICFLLFFLILAIFVDYFLFRKVPLKYRAIFPFIYGYLLWGILLSSGLRFWLISPTFYEASLVNAFAPGWLVFVALYFKLAIKEEARWFEIAATTAIALPLMLVIQILTGFIFTCAGYGDCL